MTRVRQTGRLKAVVLLGLLLALLVWLVAPHGADHVGYELFSFCLACFVLFELLPLAADLVIPFSESALAAAGLTRLLLFQRPPPAEL